MELAAAPNDAALIAFDIFSLVAISLLNLLLFLPALITI